MHQSAYLPIAAVIAEYRHLRCKNTGVIVGHDIFPVYVIFLLGLAVGTLHLIDEKVLVEPANIVAVVIGHHGEAPVLRQHIMEPLMVTAGKLHRVTLRLIIGRVTVDRGLRVIMGGDDALEILILQRYILQAVRTLPNIPKKSLYISASNGSYVNALDISKEYGDGRNPLVLKSEFIMSLCEQLMGADEIGAKEKSIIDRCTANIYRKYIRRYEGDPPTLKDLYDDLMRQKEPVAHEIALALELFTTGSLNVFAHQTNIDTRNRIICYDIQDLGENLKPIGLLVMLDSILNRVIRNRQQGRYTHVYIDEIYLFFASPGVGGKSAINNYSSEFLYKCWKRFRKYYATLTGITQNVEECLLSDTARLMFANSEFLVLLNQAPTDRAELAKLLDASDAQMDYVSDAPAGHGLIKVGSCLVPFINELPRDTELYRLMTTKPGEQNA